MMNINCYESNYKEYIEDSIESFFIIEENDDQELKIFDKTVIKSIINSKSIYILSDNKINKNLWDFGYNKFFQMHDLSFDKAIENLKSLLYPQYKKIDLFEIASKM